MEAVALFSFTASEADEISFQKGDVIKVSVCGCLGLDGLDIKINWPKLTKLRDCMSAQ